MHSDNQYRAVMALIELSRLTDSEIHRRTGVPRRTINQWRHDPRRPPFDRQRNDQPGMPCSGCRPDLADADQYLYLLGAYLGDGTINQARRGVYTLRITCDRRYPGIVEGVTQAIHAVKQKGRVNPLGRQGCIDVTSSWKHWPCVFPQHGPGPKHLRSIVLAPWQVALVGADPRAFIRGLIHSDGCRFDNVIRRTQQGRTIQYVYARYMFSNTSKDIRLMFTAALDQLGIRWTQANGRNISVARRQDVAALDAFVGPKR